MALAGQRRGRRSTQRGLPAADRRHLGDHASDPTVDRAYHEPMSAGVAAPPHADPISVDAGEGLRKRDRMAVVAHLDPRVQLLPRLAFALAEVPVVVGEHDMPGARDRRRVLIEVELLQSVVTVRHDDNRRVRCDRSRTVEPPAQRGSLRIELDVGDLEPVVLPDHMATVPHALAARGYYLT